MEKKITIMNQNFVSYGRYYWFEKSVICKIIKRKKILFRKFN